MVSGLGLYPPACISGSLAKDALQSPCSLLPWFSHQHGYGVSERPLPCGSRPTPTRPELLTSTKADDGDGDAADDDADADDGDDDGDADDGDDDDDDDDADCELPVGKQ